MSLPIAIFLGILQGITEFLPISSSGHLVIAETLFGLQVETLKDFDIALHLATLLAILIYFRRDLLDWRLWPWLILGSIPAALVGFTLEEPIDALFRNAISVSIFMIVIGLLFFIPQKKEGAGLTWWRALLIGCAQALAIIPGVSRSGSTIFAGIHLGLKRTDAARFSFLLGALAIAGAGLLKALDGENSGLSFSILAAGFLAAFLSSLAAVNWLMKFFQKYTLMPFGVYRIAAGLILLVGFYFLQSEPIIQNSTDIETDIENDPTVQEEAQDNPEESQDLTLIASVEGDKIRNGTSPIYLVDKAGEVVHEWVVEGEKEIFARLQEDQTLIYRANIATKPEKMNKNTQNAFVAKVDREGDPLWTYKNPYIHHDFLELPSGHMLFTVWEPYSEQTGEEFWSDVLLEWDPETEEILWEWHAIDHLELGLVENTEHGADLTHFNGLDYADGKILVSSHVLNKVFMIDHVSGEIVWQSEGGVLNGQHSPTFLENGNILVFNNRDKPHASAVLEISRESQEVLWSYRAAGFFSNTISGAQRLENGNTLITEGESGTVFEVSPEGEIVWTYAVGGKVFKAFRY